MFCSHIKLRAISFILKNSLSRQFASWFIPPSKAISWWWMFGKKYSFCVHLNIKLPLPLLLCKCGIPKIAQSRSCHLEAFFQGVAYSCLWRDILKLLFKVLRKECYSACLTLAFDCQVGSFCSIGSFQKEKVGNGNGSAGLILGFQIVFSRRNKFLPIKNTYWTFKSHAGGQTMAPGPNLTRHLLLCGSS